MNRPYIKKWHFVLELIGYVFAIASLLVGIVGQFTLPPEIATSFDATGNVTDYDATWILLFLPGMMLMTNAIFTVCLHAMPASKWNLPKPVIPGREVLIYGDISAMCCELILLMGAFSLVFNLSMYYAWGRLAAYLGFAMAPIVFIIIGVTIVQMTRHNRA